VTNFLQVVQFDPLLLESPVAGAAGPTGPTGATGAAGALGPAGPAGPAVAWAGIIADGVTDNHAALSSYMAALSAQGGGSTPPLPPGVIATSELTIPAYVTLVGAGCIDTENQYNNLVSRLVPAGPGQTSVVTIPAGSWSPSLQNLVIDALSNSKANSAAHALEADALFRFDNLTLSGGTVSTLVGSATAVGVVGTNLFVWTMDDLGGVKPIDNVASDWQITNAYTSATGSLRFGGGAQCRWVSCHFVTGVPAGVKGTAPLAIDLGRQHFVGCYFDGTPGTAMIDRSAAVAVSTYTDTTFLQSTAGVTGIPVIKEATTAGCGAIISTAICTGAPAAGSTFTNFIDTSLADTSIMGVMVQNASWLTGNFAGTGTAGFFWNISVNNVPVLVQPLALRGASGANAFTSGITGDSVPRLQINADGTVSFGSGAAAADAFIIRYAVAVLGIGGSVRPDALNSRTVGVSGVPFQRFYYGPAASAPFLSAGTGTPEAVVTAPIGSLYTRYDGGAATTLYVKESGVGNTGWIAK